MVWHVESSNMQNPKPLVYRQEPGAISNLLTLQPTDDSQMQSSNKFIVSRAPMLTWTTSEPATNSALYVTNCQPTYASVLENMLANTKQTKGTQTNKTDPMTAEELEWFGPPASISQPPVFPTNSYCIHYPRLLAPPEQLNFALYPPMCFHNNIWEMMWQGGSLVLNLYVATPMPTLSDLCHSPSDIYFQPEMEFTGFDYRIKIDKSRCPEPLVIKSGDIVNILNTNMQHGRYIVDLCQMIRNGRAYFPVHYREYYGQGFTNASDPRHPSFILDIPESFCHSLVALRLRSNSDYYASLRPFPTNIS